MSLEIVKLAQVFFLNDIDMYHEETNTPLEARTSTINEDLGQVRWVKPFYYKVDAILILDLASYFRTKLEL